MSFVFHTAIESNGRVAPRIVTNVVTMLDLDGIRKLPADETHLGVVGFPIAHSISPVFQNAALLELSHAFPDFSSWHYHKIEAPVDQLGQLVELAKHKGFRGLNLTIPHKVEVLQYLDHIDPLAERMGAVNTLVFNEDGVTGHNTDGYGVVSAIQAELGVSLRDRQVVIVGAGGASRGACVQSLEEGCSALFIVNRNQQRLAELLKHLQRLYPNREIAGCSPGDTISEIGSKAVLINATSLGLKPGDPCPVGADLLKRVGCIYDMVYGLHKTATIEAAGKFGIPAADGLAMLVHQGARSLEIWTGKTVTVEVMRDAVRSHMGGA